MFRSSAVAAALMIGLAGAAQAVTVTTTCPTVASSTARVFSVATAAPGASCFATGTGNISGNSQGANSDPLFGLMATAFGPGSVLIDKSDSGPAILNVTGAGTRTGLWSFTLPTPPVGKVWTNIVLAFKSGQGGGRTNITGPDWAAFLLPKGVTTGVWAIVTGKQSLSHANVYAQLAPATVPVPAAVLMLTAGLGAIGAVRRRRKA